jgi:hypothetical protein
MFSRTVFERRAPLSLPEVEAALSSRLTSTHTLTGQLLGALTAAYREAARNSVTGASLRDQRRPPDSESAARAARQSAIDDYRTAHMMLSFYRASGSQSGR